MIIKKITVKKIKDSRGNPTVEIILTDQKNKIFSAQIPSGKSRGSHEAKVFNFEQSVKSARFIESKLKEKKFPSIRLLDNFLIRLDGSSRKENLGGNVLLGISIAFARLVARNCKKELWQILRQEFFPKNNKILSPVIFANLIEGGVHAKNSLNIQEYLVLVKPRKPLSLSINQLEDFYLKLGQVLRRIDRDIRFGDEGGYSLNFFVQNKANFVGQNNFEPIRILQELIYKLNLERNFLLGIDAAASEFKQKGYYFFEKRKINSAGLKKVYLNYFRQAPLLYSIEDPYDEKDRRGFSRLFSALPDKLIIGDDLTTTNAEFIREYAQKLINGVIIKPNQIGTVSETCKAINVAHRYGLKCIISHRSGEVPDTFIIHLAKSCGAYGVKIGAPVKSRISKYNELIRLYK